MPKPPLYLKGFHDFSESDKNELQAAKSLLETPSFIARITDLVGKPIEAGLELLPEDWNEGIAEVTRAALLNGISYFKVSWLCLFSASPICRPPQKNLLPPFASPIRSVLY